MNKYKAIPVFLMILAVVFAPTVMAEGVAPNTVSKTYQFHLYSDNSDFFGTAINITDSSDLYKYNNYNFTYKDHLSGAYFGPAFPSYIVPVPTQDISNKLYISADNLNSDLNVSVSFASSSITNNRFNITLTPHSHEYLNTNYDLKGLTSITVKLNTTEPDTFLFTISTDINNNSYWLTTTNTPIYKFIDIDYTRPWNTIIYQTAKIQHSYLSLQSMWVRVPFVWDSTIQESNVELKVYKSDEIHDPFAGTFPYSPTPYSSNPLPSSAHLVLDTSLSDATTSSWSITTPEGFSYTLNHVRLNFPMHTDHFYIFKWIIHDSGVSSPLKLLVSQTSSTDYSKALIVHNNRQLALNVPLEFSGIMLDGMSDSIGGLTLSSTGRNMIEYHIKTNPSETINMVSLIIPLISYDNSAIYTYIYMHNYSSNTWTYIHLYASNYNGFAYINAQVWLPAYGLSGYVDEIKLVFKVYKTAMFWTHESSNSFLVHYSDIGSETTETYHSFSLLSEIFINTLAPAQVNGNLFDLAESYHVNLEEGENAFSDWQFNLAVMFHALYNVGDKTVQFINTVSKNPVVRAITDIIKTNIIAMNPQLLVGYYLIKNIIIPAITTIGNAIWGFLQWAYTKIIQYAPMIKAILTDLIQLGILLMFFITPLMVSLSFGKLVNFFVLTSRSTSESMTYLQVEGEHAFKTLSNLAEIAIGAGKRASSIFGGLIK